MADRTNALAPAPLNALADLYQRYIGQPFAAVAGGGGRGFLGLEPPSYGGDVARQAYRTGQAVGNMPGVGAPAGAFKAATQFAPEAAMFIGAMAKTWDRASNARAQELEKAGVNARTIWQETGNWRGPDGNWRQEISDVPAKYDPEALAELKAIPSFDYLSHTQPLGGTLSHKELYAAYPNLENVPVHFMPAEKAKGAAGAYSAPNDALTLIDTPKNQKLSAIHEIQHAVQQRENFAQGGNWMMAFQPQNKEAFALLAQKRREMQTPLSLQEYTKQAWGMNAPTDEVRKSYADYVKATKQASLSPAADRAAQEWAGKEYYRRLAGEAEARAVQARMNMTPAERRATFPEESYDVPLKNLIIKRK